MSLAIRTGQPFLDIVQGWDPRDVDTAYRLLLDQAREAHEQDRDRRFAQMTEELKRREGRG